jgi:zinc protease
LEAGRVIPAVKRPSRLRLPAHTDTRLRTGLRVVALRKPIVPRVEFRLRIPAGRAQDGSAAGVRAMLLAEALLAGTSTSTALQIAERAQTLGASLGVVCGPDEIMIRGGVLKENLRATLDLVHEVLVDATFPADELQVSAERLAQGIEIGRSQAATLAAEAVMGRAFGTHRYARPQPDPAAVLALKGRALTTYAKAMLAPKGAHLVLVGDLQPDKAIDLAAETFGGWRSKAGPRYETTVEPGADPVLQVVDRPGSVQTNIRLIFPGLDRRDPAYPALLLAQTVLAGYFTARLVRNIRETRGYCYTVGSRMEVRRLAAMIHLQAPVGVDVTAPALREVRYELARLVTETVEPGELDAVKAFLSGQALLSMQTQDVLASVVDGLLAEGCDLGYLETYAPMLHAVTAEEILAAAQAHLAPTKATTVLVGDAATIRPSLEITDQVEVRPDRP